MQWARPQFEWTHANGYNSSREGPLGWVAPPPTSSSESSGGGASASFGSRSVSLFGVVHSPQQLEQPQEFNRL